MKKVNQFYITLALIVAIIISSNVNAFALEKETIKSLYEPSKVANIVVDSKVIKNKTNTMNIDLTIPVVKGLKDTAFESKLNSETENKVLSFAAKLEKDAIEFEKDAQKNGFPFHPYELVVKYDLHYNKDALLSYTMDVYYYTGGAHGMTERESFNIDTKTAKRLELKDLFKEGYNYKEPINTEIMKSIKESQEGTYFPNEFKTIVDNQPFYLSDKGVVIYFGLYEIAPYVTGMPEFIMPAKIFEGNLKYKI